ncbi:ABC transporter permease [Actinomadura sp. KC345]|uniref:ABC transporter permease n=1 Tax=Actinomadura sp. KC345 TaxID=2530371 RepID=UPI0010430C42|nr:ABC transporter permease [Actinomadura sp. KC345]TDC55043.1 ABC transporter permease [Actinomadura sp. KC345]
MSNPMWLIARRSFTEGWPRLIATLLAALGSIALIAGSLQFALRAQEAVSGSDASEYFRADVLVQGGTVDPDEPFAPPGGRIRLDRVASRPGVATAAGDAAVAVRAARPDGRAIMASAEGRTLLRPWVSDPRLNPYRLEAGRAPASDGEVAVVRHVSRAGNLRVGDAMALTLPHRTRRVRIAGVVSVQGRDAVAGGDLVLAPPETVRRAATLPRGTWQGVWVKAAAGVPADRLRDELARDLDGAATVRTAESVGRAQSAAAAGEGASIASVVGMLASVAIFVGLFVVANTFGVLVRQRTRRLALLGAIGATPRQIKRLIRLEALTVGVIASAGGVAAGFPLSALIIRLFARDGFDVSAAGARFGWAALGLPAAAGILVTQIAAWRAARQAAGIPPVQALRTTAAETRERRRPRLPAALAIFAGAGFWYAVAVLVRVTEPPGQDRTTGVGPMILFGSACAVAGLAVLTPFFVGPLGGLVGRAGTLISGETGRLAHATITRSPRRVASAASSLMVAVALVASVVLVTQSVNDRFQEAGRQVMTAEYAITATARTPEGAPAPLSRDMAALATDVPGVSRATALTQTEVKLASPPPDDPDPDEEPEPFPFMVTGAEQTGLREVLRLGGGPPALRPGQIALSSSVMKARPADRRAGHPGPGHAHRGGRLPRSLPPVRRGGARGTRDDGTARRQRRDPGGPGAGRLPRDAGAHRCRGPGRAGPRPGRIRERGLGLVHPAATGDPRLHRLGAAAGTVRDGDHGVDDRRRTHPRVRAAGRRGRHDAADPLDRPLGGGHGGRPRHDPRFADRDGGADGAAPRLRQLVPAPGSTVVAVPPGDGGCGGGDDCVVGAPRTPGRGRTRPGSRQGGMIIGCTGRSGCVVLIATSFPVRRPRVTSLSKKPHPRPLLSLGRATTS